jgi:hypothetical protein
MALWGDPICVTVRAMRCLADQHDAPIADQLENGS